MAMSMGSFATRTVATVVVAVDGTGDFTNIQDGLDSLPATGGCVYVKEGTYIITASITIPSNNIAIIGCGRSTIIQTTLNIRMITANLKSGLLIERISLYGAGALHPLNDGIMFAQVSLSRISQCWIHDCGRYGISLSLSYGVTISGNHVYDNISDGIYIVSSADNNNIIENVCYSNGGAGINIIEARMNIIAGNNCYDNENGIYVNDGDYISICGNVCTSNEYDGIYLLGYFCSVTGNVCMNNGVGGVGAGIRLFRSYWCSVTGNVCSTDWPATQDYGIFIAIDGDAADRNILVSNMCLNNTVAQIQDNGTNTEIGHNITV